MKSTTKKKPGAQYRVAEVISIVSHQLKTPLSAIKGYLEVLISEDLGKLNDKQKEYLDSTLKSTMRMIKLATDFLDVSRIEEGKVELKPKPTNFKKIVADTIKEFAILARAKNCEIVFTALNTIPLIKIDPLKIKQVVANLISNAVEYNRGKGLVEVSLKKQNNEVIFSCKDGGIGIPKYEQKRIFKKFYRSEKAVTLATQGSGIGLFIAKAIINKSGGKIWFKSKQGEGSTFSFSLPIDLSRN